MRKQLQKSYLSRLRKELEPNTNWTLTSTPVSFSFSYTSTAQCSEPVWNPGFQDDFKMTGWSSPLSGHYGLLKVHHLHGHEGKILVKLPRLRTVDGNYHEVTWMSLRRLVNLSTRGTHSGPRRVSQLGCMYSEARRWVRNCKDFLYSSSVQFSHSVVSNSLWPHRLQHARPPYPSPTPRAFYS